MITIRLVQTQDRNLNQLQQNIKQAVESPFTESVGSFIGNFSGFSQDISGVVNWQTGTTQNGVILQLPGISGTSTSTSMAMTGLPTNLYPKTAQTVFASVFDNAIIAVGYATIGTDGIITFSKDVSFGAFTASGTKGVVDLTISYIRGI